MRQAVAGTWSESKPNAGPIPLDRHEAVLNGIRSEFDTYKQTHGWAEKVPQEAIQRYADLDQAMADDPVQVAYDLMQEAAKNPKFAAKIKSLAARTLAGRPAPVPAVAPPAPDEMPGPDTDQGYSPTGLKKLLDWNRQQVLSEAETRFRKELDPVRSVAQTLETQRQQVERSQYVDSRTAELSKEIAALPLATDHEAAIADAFMKLPARTEADLVANMYRAYHSVVGPKIQGNAKQAAMAALTTQAQANTARPNGSRAGVVTPGQPKRFGQALREAAAAASR